MNYDLLVVGNGFDLGANFKTSYKDFLMYEGQNGIRNSLISFLSSANNRGFFINDEWNGFEKLICHYLQFLAYCFSDNENIESWFSESEPDGFNSFYHRYYHWKIKDVKNLPNNVFLVLCLSNALNNVLWISPDSKFSVNFAGIDSYNYLKEVYFKVLVNVRMVNATRENVLNFILDELNRELLDLEKELQNYIRISTGDTRAPSFIADHKPNRIVSFNYSETAQKYYDLDDEHIAYIHGRVSTTVVIGVEPSMISNQSFDEESNFIRFFKRYRRIYKNCNGDYNNKIINKLSNDSIIAIYGHSLDLSDKSILKPLFEHRYKRYDIYCYNNQDEYKLKLSKLIGLDLLNELNEDSKINFIDMQ